MKKILIALVCCMCLVSCGNSSVNQEESEQTEKTTHSLFVTIYDDNPYYDDYYKIVYDKETLVEYAISNGHNNRGTLTMLVDSLGKPKLYKK